MVGKSDLASTFHLWHDELLHKLNIPTRASDTMKIIKAITPFFLIVVLASCSAFISTPEISPTEVMETSLSGVKTEIVGTLTANPTGTFSPALPTPTYLSAPTVVYTPRPDEQVYTDPAGWYSILFPADMKPTDKPATFSRMGYFFETGYLPELGYMSNVMNICAWVANIELAPEQSGVDWSPMMYPEFESQPRCSVSSHPYEGQTIRYEVFEIPAADPQHRFVYIKTNWGPYEVVQGQAPFTRFAWLKPILPRQEATLPTLSQEELSEWEKIAPLLQGASVTEYALPPGSDPRHQDNLFEGLPEEALTWRKNLSKLPVPTQTPTVEEQLKPLGYELIRKESGWKRLLRDHKILFENVIRVSQVYTFSTDSGPIHTFVVNTAGTGGNYENSFLVQNDAVYQWEYNVQDPYYLAPILQQNEVLWVKAAKAGGHVQVIKSNQEVVSSFAVYTEPLYAVNRFTSWNGHWVLGARDFLLEDGEFVNKKLGFEEIFSWGLIADKPIYLFRKGARIGVSYDGKILPLNYQDVARYMCCSPAMNNPSIDPDSLRFFAQRDGLWYYVVVRIK